MFKFEKNKALHLPEDDNLSGRIDSFHEERKGNQSYKWRAQLADSTTGLVVSGWGYTPAEALEKACDRAVSAGMYPGMYPRGVYRVVSILDDWCHVGQDEFAELPPQ